MKKRRQGSLFYKFVMAILFLGLLPMVFLATVVFNQMFSEYEDSLKVNYEQAASHASSTVSNTFESYNNVSKMIYQYGYNVDKSIGLDFNGYDKLRQMINGVGYEPDMVAEERARDMELFLRSLQSIDSYIYAAHFIGFQENGEEFKSHFSVYNPYFRNEELFRSNVGYENWEKENDKLILIPPHKAEYFGDNHEVITVARNYFDIRGEIGDRKYVGTLFLDINIDGIKYLLKPIEFKKNEKLYLFDRSGNCFYSNQGLLTENAITEAAVKVSAEDNQLMLETGYNEYGIKVMVLLDKHIAFSDIRAMQNMMYVFLGLTATVLLGGAIFFSKRLTAPIRDMMTQMSQIETGNFQIELPVNRNDEIGILSERFNLMSQELKRYIDKSYVAQVKQSEAELTALKAQIYPHFLYNTLEVIRMTALEQEGEVVADMIEAFAEQIRYLIGPLKDDVPLAKEIDIIKKYVYLLNCRIKGKVNLSVTMKTQKKILVPKLILQPIIENAYVHGIKPKGKGDILIEVTEYEEGIEIAAMDNGVGMNSEEIEKINRLLMSDEIGINNEYNWQSIGLKNVHDRLRHLFGENYGIKVTSTKGIGTIVGILIPYTEEKAYDKDDYSR